MFGSGGNETEGSGESEGEGTRCSRGKQDFHFDEERLKPYGKGRMVC